MKFFPAKYIIRLDDACHQMPYKKWKKFEDYFIKNNIKPIVGVVPNNRDKVLGDNYNKDFWAIIKKWENSGWSIALHGLNHILHPIDSSKTFFDFGSKSEFVGLIKKDQERILKKSLSIFKNNKVSPKIFMAPSHSFDKETLECLKKYTEIKIISDGFSYRPFIKEDLIFIPQQFWSVKKMPFGLYTICIHPTTMKDKSIINTLEKLNSIKNNITSVDNLDLENLSNYNFKDLVFNTVYKIIFNYKFRVK